VFTINTLKFNCKLSAPHVEDTVLDANRSLARSGQQLMDAFADALRAAGGPKAPTDVTGWAALRWWVAGAVSQLALRDTDTANDARRAALLREVLAAMEEAVRGLVAAKAEATQAAVKAWIDCVSLAGPWHCLCEDLVAAGTDPKVAVAVAAAQPLMAAADAVVTRVAFHFGTWALTEATPQRDTDARGGGGAEGGGIVGAPEHFLDYAHTALRELRDQVDVSLAAVESAAVRAAVRDRVLAGCGTNISALFAARFVTPAVDRAAADAAPLLHLATVAGNFVAAYHDGGLPAPAPCVGILTEDADACATWLAAERHFVLTTLLGDEEAMIATLARGTVDKADWRRAQLSVYVAERPLGLSGGSIAAVPYSSLLPSAVRSTPAALIACTQRAAPILQSASTTASWRRAWLLMIDRVLVWCAKWWIDVIDAASFEVQGLVAIVRGVLAPAEYLATQLREVVMPLLRSAITQSHGSQTMDALASAALLSAVEAEVDRLSVQRDGALRRAAFILTCDPREDEDAEGVHAARERDLLAAKPFCSVDAWAALSAVAGHADTE
jgi:hypothetical protein